MTWPRRATLVSVDGVGVTLRRDPDSCHDDECGSCEHVRREGGELREDRWFRLVRMPRSVICALFERADLGDVDEPSRCVACRAGDITPAEQPLDGAAPAELHDARYPRGMDESEHEAWDEDCERARRGE